MTTCRTIVSITLTGVAACAPADTDEIVGSSRQPLVLNVGPIAAPGDQQLVLNPTVTPIAEEAPPWGTACVDGDEQNECFAWYLKHETTTAFVRSAPQSCSQVCTGFGLWGGNRCYNICLPNWESLEADCDAAASARAQELRDGLDNSLNLDRYVAVDAELTQDNSVGTCQLQASYPSDLAPLPPRWDQPVGSAMTEDRLDEEPHWTKETFVGVVPPGFCCPKAGVRDDEGKPVCDDGSDPDAEHNGWKGGLMFPGRSVADQPLAENGGLFCRYEYTVAAGAEGDNSNKWDDLPSQMVSCDSPSVTCLGGAPVSAISAAKWLRPDARVVAAQAPEFAGALTARLQEEYLAAMDAPLAPAAAPRADRTTLAILDTVRDSVGDETGPVAGPADHGRALAMAALRTACADGAHHGDDCPLNFRFFRAYEPGTVASLSDLAAQIVRAADDAANQGRNAVLNISQGLHPRFARWDLPETAEPGSLLAPADPALANGEMLPAFLAVKAALNYAASRGALVVAAGGNTDGYDAEYEDLSEEYLYPAAFFGEDGWDCSAERECTPVANRTLVWPVAGILDNGDGLPNARSDFEQVPFVAPGCNVALDNGEGNDLLPIYCGSSFGAIGVSTVLASTWTFMPNASAEDVVAFVRSTGRDRRTDAACGDTNCRVQLCNSLQAAGAAVQCRDGADAPLDPVEGLEAFVADNAVDAQWESSAGGDSPPGDVDCDGEVVFSSEDRNDHPCPIKAYKSSLPDSGILVDQPGAGVCHHCLIAILLANGVSTPYFIGQLNLAADINSVKSPSLQYAGRNYELSSNLAGTAGSSFAVPLLPAASGFAPGTAGFAATSSASAPESASGVAAFSYLVDRDEEDEGAGDAPEYAQVDAVPVLD